MGAGRPDTNLEQFEYADRHAVSFLSEVITRQLRL